MRSISCSVQDLVCVGAFRLDPVQERLWRGAEEIRLRPKTFALLYHLIQHPERFITKAELLDAVWEGTSVSDAAIKVCISEIRRALGRHPGESLLIETRRRQGYRLVLQADAPPRTIFDRGASVRRLAAPHTPASKWKPADAPRHSSTRF